MQHEQTPQLPCIEHCSRDDSKATETTCYVSVSTSQLHTVHIVLSPLTHLGPSRCRRRNKGVAARPPVFAPCGTYVPECCPAAGVGSAAGGARALQQAQPCSGIQRRE